MARTKEVKQTKPSPRTRADLVFVVDKVVVLVVGIVALAALWTDGRVKRSG